MMRYNASCASLDQGIFVWQELWYCLASTKLEDRSELWCARLGVGPVG